MNVTSLCAIVHSCLLEVNNPVDNIEHNKEDWETLQEELVNSEKRKKSNNYEFFNWRFLPPEILGHLLSSLQYHLLLLGDKQLLFEQDRSIPGQK